MQSIGSSDLKNKSDESIFVGQKVPFFLMDKSKKKEIINMILTLSVIFIIIILLIVYLIIKPNLSYNNLTKPKKYTQKNIFIQGNYSIVYNNQTMSDSNFSKYKNMLPNLSHDLNKNPSSIEEIFNAREIYISDERITPDYIRYIRPINETEELKYKKPYSEKETIIDKKIFDTRQDQIDYVNFSNVNLAEDLIRDKNMNMIINLLYL